MENKNNNSSIPFAIIGIVLLVAIVGGWWFYQSSKATPANKTKKENVNKNTNNEEAAYNRYMSAPPGAQPPNMLGSPTAEVTVEEFADYQCPTCAVVHPKMKELTGYYGNRIKFIYRNFPLTQIHKNAYDAAVAAEAAGLQGKFWAMQDQLYNNQQQWSNSSEPRKLFDEYAQRIGLDVNQFQNDMAGIVAKQRVDADMARARAVGAGGTPAIYINGRELGPDQMDFPAMRQIIDTELARSSQMRQMNTGQQTAPSNSTSGTTQTGNTASESKPTEGNSAQKK